MKVLYISRLKISLLFIKLFYKEFKVKKAFNNKKMYFYKNRKILLFTNNFYDIYIIINIIKINFNIVFSIKKTKKKISAKLEDIIYNENKMDRMEIQKRNQLNRY